MKKMIGLVVLSVFCFVVASALAQVLAAPATPVAAPAATAVAAPVVAAAATAVAAVAAPAAQEITVKGKVSVVKEPDGATLKLIFINPSEPGSHGYKVDIVNGEGKTLADKHGQIVEATGVDANRLFTIKTITVME
jgi:hypothetical protein